MQVDCIHSVNFCYRNLVMLVYSIMCGGLYCMNHVYVVYPLCIIQVDVFYAGCRECSLSV